MASFRRRRLLLTMLVVAAISHSAVAWSSQLLWCRTAFNRVFGPDRVVGETGVTFYSDLFGGVFSSTNGVVEVTMPNGRRLQYNRTNRGIEDFIEENLYSFDMVSPEALKGMRVLDLGCGDGRFVFELRHRGIEAVGVDVYLSSRQVQSRYFERAEAWDTGLDSNDFDVVFITWSTVSYIHKHSGDPDVESARNTLLEAARVLKPGGSLRISPMNTAGARSSGQNVEIFDRVTGERLILLEDFEISNNAAGTESGPSSLSGFFGLHFVALKKR